MLWLQHQEVAMSIQHSMPSSGWIKLGKSRVRACNMLWGSQGQMTYGCGCLHFSVFPSFLTWVQESANDQSLQSACLPWVGRSAWTSAFGLPRDGDGGNTDKAPLSSECRHRKIAFIEQGVQGNLWIKSRNKAGQYISSYVLEGLVVEVCV